MLMLISSGSVSHNSIYEKSELKFLKTSNFLEKYLVAEQMIYHE